MKYLFFDIECANCYDDKGKICEFGYVITDEKFNVTDSDEIVVNPDSEFDSYVIKNMLAYNEEFYKSKPLYPQCYDRIRSLFTDDVVVFGHTVERDAHYLNCESQRYNLPYINYKFYDAKNMFKDCYGKGTGLKLHEICEFFKLEKAKHEHRASDDAYSTMLIVREMCKAMKYDIKSMIKISENCPGYTLDGDVHTVEGDRIRAIKDAKEKIGICLTGGDVKRFINDYEPEIVNMNNYFSGKTITITNNYQKSHHVEMGILIKLMKDNGCNYSYALSECDYLVTKDCYDEYGKLEKCNKTAQVQKLNKKGSSIKTIAFDDFLNYLGITEDTLIEKGEMLNRQWLKKENELKESGIIKTEEKKEFVYTDDNKSATLSDIVKSKSKDKMKFA